MKKLIINASNCHSGGGKTLILGFLKGVSNDTKTIVYVDDRLEINFPLCNSIQLIKISRYKRFLIGFMIKKILNENDKIIYFGNLPPYLKFNCNNVILQLSSRFYVDSISMKGFGIKNIIRIYLEKLYYKFFIKNVTQVIVQTSSMYEKLILSGFKKEISILAFDDLGNNIFKQEKKEKDSFIYVASLFPYKNHKRLLMAWEKLKSKNISPKLYLTIDGNTNKQKWIKEFVSTNKLNVILLSNISRSELLSVYSKVETLIYPSLFEAYGLPLIEARKYKMKIIASDLDYCWDFVEPDDFFNPYDVDSIARSLMRFLKKKRKLDVIYSPNEFFNKIVEI